MTRPIKPTSWCFLTVRVAGNVLLMSSVVFIRKFIFRKVVPQHSKGVVVNVPVKKTFENRSILAKRTYGQKFAAYFLGHPVHQYPCDQ